MYVIFFVGIRDLQLNNITIISLHPNISNHQHKETNDISAFICVFTILLYLNFFLFECSNLYTVYLSFIQIFFVFFLVLDKKLNSINLLFNKKNFRIISINNNFFL